MLYHQDSPKTHVNRFLCLLYEACFCTAPGPERRAAAYTGTRERERATLFRWPLETGGRKHYNAAPPMRYVGIKSQTLALFFCASVRKMRRQYAQPSTWSAFCHAAPRRDCEVDGVARTSVAARPSSINSSLTHKLLLCVQLGLSRVQGCTHHAPGAKPLACALLYSYSRSYLLTCIKMEGPVECSFNTVTIRTF